MSAPILAEVYSIVRKNLENGFELVAPEDYLAWLLVNNEAAPEFTAFLHDLKLAAPTAGFRREILVNGFPVLLGVLPVEKKIYAASRRLSR